MFSRKIFLRSCFLPFISITRLQENKMLLYWKSWLERKNQVESDSAIASPALTISEKTDRRMNSKKSFLFSSLKKMLKNTKRSHVTKKIRYLFLFFYLTLSRCLRVYMFLIHKEMKKKTVWLWNWMRKKDEMWYICPSQCVH